MAGIGIRLASLPFLFRVPSVFCPWLPADHGTRDQFAVVPAKASAARSASKACSARRRAERPIAARRFGVLQQPHDRRRQRRGVVRRDQASRSCFRRKDLARAADVGRHNGHAGCRRLQQDAAQRFLPRGMSQQGEFVQQPFDVVADAQEMDAASQRPDCRRRPVPAARIPTLPVSANNAGRR